MRQHRFTLLCACLLLVACGGDKPAASNTQPGEDTLPQPGTAGGSVTGMPNPGTPSAQPAPLPEEAADDEGMGIDDDGDDAPFDPDQPTDPAASGMHGDVAIPPPETMPTMPAPTPDPAESRAVPPTDS